MNRVAICNPLLTSNITYRQLFALLLLRHLLVACVLYPHISTNLCIDVCEVLIVSRTLTASCLSCSLLVFPFVQSSTFESIMSSPPAQKCNATKPELLAADLKATSVCPLCQECGAAVKVGFHRDASSSSSSSSQGMHDETWLLDYASVLA